MSLSPTITATISAMQTSRPASRVWLKPRVFAYVVAAWLLLIIANLLLIPGYFDVAPRDLGLALGALALNRTSLFPAI